MAKTVWPVTALQNSSAAGCAITSGRRTVAFSMASPVICGSITCLIVSISGNSGILCTAFFRRFFDFAVVEIVDHDRQRAKRAADTVVIRHIIKAHFRGIRFQLCVKHFPISAAVSVINILIPRQKSRIFLFDIIHNDRPAAAAQVEVFQPYQIALLFCPFQNRLDTGNAGKNRGDKTGGANARRMKHHSRLPASECHSFNTATISSPSISPFS